jgi:hypothetical protein
VLLRPGGAGQRDAAQGAAGGTDGSHEQVAREVWRLERVRWTLYRHGDNERFYYPAPMTIIRSSG